MFGVLQMQRPVGSSLERDVANKHVLAVQEDQHRARTPCAVFFGQDWPVCQIAHSGGKCFRIARVLRIEVGADVRRCHVHEAVALTVDRTAAHDGNVVRIAGHDDADQNALA